MTDAAVLVGLGGLLLGFALGSPKSSQLFRFLRGIRYAASLRERVKMVLVVRQDITMSKGKTAAQCAHAAIACYRSAEVNAPEVLNAWLATGQSKIVLKSETPGQQSLQDIVKAARAAGVVAESICDAGHTEIAKGTMTVVGVGPGPDSLVNKATGHLRTL